MEMSCKSEERVENYPQSFKNEWKINGSRALVSTQISQFWDTVLISCTELIQGQQQLTAYLAAHQLQNSLATLLGDADPMLLDLVLDFILKSPFAGKL